MKLTTFNVNGVRSALSKGLADWLAAEKPDILCLQEIKLAETHLVENVFLDLGYHCYWHPAEKRGYSGVATFSLQPAVSVKYGMNIAEYDREGRVLVTEFPEFTLVNTYFPSGSSGDERQQYKFDFLADYHDFINNLKVNHPHLLVCGDVNICHQAIDIHNPTRNKNTSGFLDEERAWVSKFLESGFLDTFRYFNDQPHHYTWWTYRAGARGKNLGWRIDYFFASLNLSEKLANSEIHPDVYMSDHCPVSVYIN